MSPDADEAGAFLVVIDPEGDEARVPLAEWPMTLGRLPDADVHLPAAGVSRIHARVLREIGRYFVEDMDSTNGTFVNGERVARKALRDGDRILLGRSSGYTVVFQRAGTEV